MSISLKLKLIVLAFASIVTLMFIATLYATNRQKNDGLIINLAGRQRMLTQKMSKELYHFMHVSEKMGKLDEVTVNVSHSPMVAGEVAKDISEVNEEAGQMAVSSSQLTNRSKELHNLSENLSEMIDKFTV